MNHFSILKRNLALLVPAVLVLAFGFFSRPASAQQSLDHYLYLPLVMHGGNDSQVTPTPTFTQTVTDTPTSTPTPTQTPTPTPEPSAQPGAFGVAADASLTAQEFTDIAQSGADLVRLEQPLYWADVEPTQGERNWNALADLEAQMQAASANNLPVIVTLESAPAWAVPSGDCGPVLSDALPALAAFMQDVVQRYSSPPYNVHTWELWDEPDVDGEAGCWGIAEDYYSGYGGVYYAAMLQAVYPVIKAADPNAIVLVGGLRLDCNPNNPPGTRDCTMSNFFEGILAGGGGSYLDGVSFHAADGFGIYPTAWDVAFAYADPGWGAAWNTTGPVLQKKTAFIRSLLERYGAGDKLLLNTRAAIPCASCAGFSEYETARAAYVVQSFAAAKAAHLDANIWHTWLGWQNSGLANTQALQAFTFAHQKLGEAIYIGLVLPTDVGGLPDVMGYKFDVAGQELWVLWYASTIEPQHALSFAATPAQAWDMTGSPLNPDSLIVSMNPIYILWP